MSVKLLKTGGVASLSDLRAIERIVGGQLPGSYCDFVNGNDGAAPESNIFRIDATNDSGVTSFIPASQIPSEIDLLGCLPARAFPVAWAEGGNYVYVDLSEGNAVFFWDHELPDSPTRLAEDFESFLELLKPFDPKSVKVKPGQVKSVWIHPDFAKKLRGEEPW